MVLRIKDMQQHDRPRERLIKQGPEFLSNAELLAILLKTGTRDKSALDLSQELLSNYDLSQLSNSSVPDLTKLCGVKDAKACQVVAAMEIGKRALSFSGAKPEIKTPEQVFKICGPMLSNSRQEKLLCFFLDSNSRLIKHRQITIGQENASLLDEKAILRMAVQEGSDYLILVHNHPSGNPEPGSEDIKATKRARKAAAVLGIEILDHIVLGDSGFVSMLERGLI